VEEFTSDPECILRLALKTSGEKTVLDGGKVIEKGEPVGELHFWNEHLPPLPPDGADLEWSKLFVQKMRYSLALLAEYVEQDPRFLKVRAFRGEMAFPGKRKKQLEEVARRLGFTTYVKERRHFLDRFTEFWENFYSWALIWAFNPPSLKKKSLLSLRRCRIWMTREKLLKKYGGDDEAQSRSVRP